MSSVHVIVGNLGQDVEIRTLGNGGRVASFSVADNESWTDKTSGERKEKTHWHEVVTFQPGLIDMLERNAKKGRLVWVRGSVVYNRYRKEGETSDRIGAQTQVGPGDEIRFLTPMGD